MARYLNSACIIAALTLCIVANQNTVQAVKFDNLYYKALQAYLETAEAKYGYLKPDRKVFRNYKDLLISREDWLKQPLPSQIGSHKVTFVTTQELMQRYQKEQAEIPITFIRPIQNEGSILIVDFVDYYFSYKKTSRKENLMYGIESGGKVELMYDSNLNEFVVTKVELWGI